MNVVGIKIPADYTTPTAANLLGITASQFRRLVEKRGMLPSGWYKNPHYRSGPECPLWASKDISRLKRTNDLKEMLQRNEMRKEIAQQRKLRLDEEKRQRMDAIRQKYPNLSAVLPDACIALFNLNRFAKWPSCSRWHRDEIYGLKNEIVRILYRLGFSDRVCIHFTPTAARTCFACDGEGKNWNDDDCEKCGGTGNFKDAGELRFVVFTFLVGETRYTWHQPENLVTWEYSLTVSEAGEWETLEPKPLEMDYSELCQAEELLRYAIQIDSESMPEVYHRDVPSDVISHEATSG